MASILTAKSAFWPIKRKGTTGAYSIRACGKSAIIIDEWLHASGLGLKRKRLA